MTDTYYPELEPRNAYYYYNLITRAENSGGDMVVENLGNLSDESICGDGSNINNFPIMREPHGMISNGDYLRDAAGLPSGTSTLCALVRWSLGTTAGYLIDSRDAGGVGYSFYNPATEAFSGASEGTVKVNGEATSSMLNGSIGFVVFEGMTMETTGNIVIASRFTFGSTWGGEIYNFAIYPGTLTQDMQDALEFKWRKDLNV